VPLNPLQVSPQFLLLQQKAQKSLYRSPGSCFLDCPIDPYIIVCSPLAAILDQIRYWLAPFNNGIQQVRITSIVSSSGEHSLTLNPMGNTFKDLILKGDLPRTIVTKFDSSWPGGFRGEDFWMCSPMVSNVKLSFPLAPFLGRTRMNVYCSLKILVCSHNILSCSLNILFWRPLSVCPSFQC
jgi:hypothetical protein